MTSTNQMLLNKGAEVDLADSRGRTPLHLAAVNGHKEVVEVLLKAEGINVNAVDEDVKTPFDLATDDKIKTLLKEAAEKTDPVDGSLKDSKGNQEEDADTEKKEGDAQPELDTTKPETGPPSTEPAVTTKDSGSSVGSPDQALTQKTEEQPSSFFGSLFSILTKPFSLIASFFGGFFSWLFGSDEPIQSSSESAQPVILESSSDPEDHNII